MSYLFSFVFPWLLVFWFLLSVASGLTRRSKNERFRRPFRSFLFVLGLLSVGIVMLPLGGVPLGRWMAGLNLSPSLPLLGLLAGQVLKSFFIREPFRATERQAGWIFGGLAGSVLYPLALGLGNVDPYAWGWSFSILFPIVALITIYLIWKQNRFGLLLFLSILAYDFRVLDSPNFWDYLVDPLYWLVSLFLLTKTALKKLWQRTAVNSVEKTC